MSKKVFIVSSTMRANGNSYLLAKEFERGAKDADNTTEFLDLKNINLNFCKGCMYCQNKKGCAIKDDMNEILKKVQNSDVLVFATPVYYYEMSGQLKTFLDRLNPLYFEENKFKEIYLIATSADTSKSALDNAINGIKGWAECFDKVYLKDVVYGTGAEAVGDIKKSQALKKAYDMGKAIK